MKLKVKDWFLLFGVAGVSIALDQWTKWLVRENIPFGGQWLPDELLWLAPYARIVYWHNSGAAFGIFQNGNLIFTILAFIVVGAILYYYPQVEDDWTLKLAMGLQLGGAVGNLIDRLMMGKVTDFISTQALPGTVEKLDVLAQRLESGLPLWHPSDRRTFDDGPVE